MSEFFTPGPLAVCETGQDDGGNPETVIRGMGGRAGVAVAIDFGKNNPKMREDNARRLVACWNVLDGVATADIEGFMSYMADLRAAIGKVGGKHAAREAQIASARALLESVASELYGTDRADISVRIRAYLKGGS